MLSTEDNSNWEMSLTFPNINGSWVSFGQDISGELYIVSINGGIYKIIDAALSQNELPLNKLSIHPNPFEEYISINIDKLSTIKIYDIYGKKIKEIYNFIGGRLDLSKLNNGVYFIEVNGYKVKKFIKK